MKLKYFYIILLLGVAGCNSHPSAADKAAALKSLHFDYPKDPACGMPLKAGLEDSTMYKGKLYGFCSKECKDEFLKDPSSFIARLIQ